MTPQEKGRLGYKIATERMGVAEFHKAGGEATAKKIDGFTCDCHGVGLVALLAHGYKPKKKHRYTKPAEENHEELEF